MSGACLLHWNRSPTLAGVRDNAILLTPCWRLLSVQLSAGFAKCEPLHGIVGLWVRQLEPGTFHWLGFTRKPPCANTYTNLLKEICPEEFEQAVREWTQTLEGIEIDDDSLRAPFDIHKNRIDGKTLRGSLQKHLRAVHLLSAPDHQTGCVLSQTRMDSKTNESKAAFDLFKTLVLKADFGVSEKFGNQLAAKPQNRQHRSSLTRKRLESSTPIRQTR